MRFPNRTEPDNKIENYLKTVVFQKNSCWRSTLLKGDIMSRPIKLKVLGGACVGVVLFCAGIYYYVQWDNKRFMAEIGEPPRSTTASEPAAETQNGETESVEQTTLIEPVEFVSDNGVVLESEPVEETELMDEEASVSQPDTSEITSETTPEFDPTPLLSAFGLPEEVTSLFDEEAEEKDIEVAETHLVEAYGQSPEVEEVVDKLRQMSGGPVELGDLTELFETWIRVLPEADQGTRRQLVSVLTQLNQIGLTGGDAPGDIEIRVIDANAFSD